MSDRVKPPKFDKNYSPLNNRNFKNGDDGSDNLANNRFQFLEFFHVPSAYFVAFKAYLTSFSDSYSSEWKEENVYGRMDPIGTFQRTSRKINVGFQVVASSAQEAEQNMRRFSLLTQMLYPVYETQPANGEVKDDSVNLTTISNGPLFKVKFLNWISNSTSNDSMSAEDGGLMGWIDGFNFSPQLEEGSFELGLDLYPKSFEVSFGFTVLHEHSLGWEKTDLDSSLADFFSANPGKGFEKFPYGKKTTSDPTKPQLSGQQIKSFDTLQAAKKKLIGGE
jgi:hypothetical protein